MKTSYNQIDNSGDSKLMVKLLVAIKEYLIYIPMKVMVLSY